MTAKFLQKRIVKKVMILGRETSLHVVFKEVAVTGRLHQQKILSCHFDALDCLLFFCNKTDTILRMAGAPCHETNKNMTLIGT